MPFKARGSGSYASPCMLVAVSFLNTRNVLQTAYVLLLSTS